LPSRDEHLAKAKHNEETASALSSEYRDWIVVALFYAGLHYLEMQLAVEGFHPPSHDKRDPLIAKHHLLHNVWYSYKSLNILSRNARYYSVVILEKDVNDARAWLENIKSYLKKIGHKLD
jgi:hypothetical protein